MKSFASLLAVWAAVAAAAPTSAVTPFNNRALAASSGPCDLSSHDTGCYLVMDNSGCFLNTTDTKKVLGCVDQDDTKAIDIFCRCWGCNGQELVNFMPTLNCTSKTVIVKPMPLPSPIGPPTFPNGNGTSTNGTAVPGNSTAPHPTTGPAPIKGPNGGTRMPVPVLPDGY